MRMRFGDDDEQAFFTRRDQLAEQFATWLEAQRTAGDPTDAELLMDWKFGYGDGFLDQWTVPEIEEFLFDWCVRKLSVPSRVAAQIPRSVAAFMEFLDATGLLAQGSDPPARVREFCEQNRQRFVQAMKDPANFGIAKSLLGGFGEPLDPDDPQLPAALREALLDEDDLLDEEGDEELPVVGPVRMPAEQEQRDAVRTAQVPRQLRLLAEYYAPPGRPLTGAGNLRLADARHLVAALETGDDPEFGGHRKLTSAQDLPVLSWLFELALAAGVVRRARGRLVAVARFAALDEAAAYEKVVRAAVTAGLSPTPYWSFPALEMARAAANDAVVGLLARLLDADGEAVPQDELVELMTALLEDVTFGIPSRIEAAIPGMVSTQVARLAALGMVTVDGDGVALTAAGVPVAIGMVRDAGFEVLLRPDPDTADAAAIADLLDVEDEQQWAEDASAWLAAQPDRGAALEELVETVCGADRATVAVMVGLAALGTLAGEQAVPAVRRQVGGAHDGLVLNWLAQRSALDPATVDPLRFVSGLVDVLAVGLDLGGAQEVVASFDHGAGEEQQLELLDHIWRLDHPRLADVLEAIGAHHPVKAVAKAARRALIRHRSWLARPPTQRP
jgi:hypothetical protein